jgi:hypothetical protein
MAALQDCHNLEQVLVWIGDTGKGISRSSMSSDRGMKKLMVNGNFRWIGLLISFKNYG